MELEQCSLKYEKLLKDKNLMEDEIQSFKRKIHVLSDALALTEKERDKRQAKVDTLYEKQQAQRIELENVVDTLKGLVSFNYLDGAFPSKTPKYTHILTLFIDTSNRRTETIGEQRART